MSSKPTADSFAACTNFLVVVVDVTGFAHSSSVDAPEAALLQSLAIFMNSYLFMSRSHDTALVSVGSDRSDIAFRSARELMRGDRGENNEERSIADVATASLLDSMSRNTATHGASSSEGTYVAIAKGLSQAMCVINRRQQHRADQSRSAGAGRILVVQRAADQPEAYNAVMNAIFSAQKAGVLIDSLVLSAASQTGSSFLQQAAFLTGGLYLCPSNAPTVQPRGAVGGSASRYVPPAVTDLTNLLLSHCLSDADTRAMLKTPPLRSLDFRAACSCHGVQVDLAYMCSVCLSLQCEATDTCATCGTPAVKA